MGTYVSLQFCRWTNYWFLRHLLVCLIYALFLFSVKEDTLLDMVQHMTEKTGLVHQMPFTCDREGFAATFEKVGFVVVVTATKITPE